MSSTQLSSALQKLAQYRVQNSRQSQDVFDQGVVLLKNKNGSWARGNDNVWVEQLALAAIDVGRIDVADECISILSEKFPGSQRVDVLIGIRKEASLPLASALEYYDGLLEVDESNLAAWKRKISILRRMGDITHVVEELSRFLDTYYSDVEGWLELTDVYSTCCQYESALRSLQHVLLLAPQNPFYVLQAAETAYTAGDLPLAAKFYLIVIDMTDDPDTRALDETVPEGIAVRAWFGLKQCTRRFIREARTASHSASQTPVPQHVEKLDELATERLLTSYSAGTSNGPASGREELIKWLEAK